MKPDKRGDESMTIKELMEKLQQYDQSLEVGYSALGFTSIIGLKKSETEKWEYPGVVVGKKTVVKIY
jgi:hypothetical protein